MELEKIHIGVHYWDASGGLMAAIRKQLIAMGCEQVSICMEGKPLPTDLDVVLTLGPFGSLTPLANKLFAFPPDRRPKLVYWMTEQLPDPRLPDGLVALMGRSSAWIERLAYRPNDQSYWKTDPSTQPFFQRMARFRYLGNLRWLDSQGLLTLLVVGSTWIADYFRRQGYDPLTAYLGYHPTWGEDLGLERDVPVLWIGKYGSRRRERLLLKLDQDLRKRGIEMTMIDGVHHPYIFGKERTVLLNRTKIVVNLLRTPWDNNAFRYYLATMNKAMIISEPSLPHTPFQPGVHLVEAQADRLGEMIAHYLAADEPRISFVERAYALLTGEMSLESSIFRILERIGKEHS